MRKAYLCHGHKATAPAPCGSVQGLRLRVEGPPGHRPSTVRPSHR